MAREGYRIFDADTHIIEPVEPVEAYLSSADRAKLAALGPLVQRSPGKGGMSRYRVGKRPELNRRLLWDNASRCYRRHRVRGPAR